MLTALRHVYTGDFCHAEVATSCDFIAILVQKSVYAYFVNKSCAPAQK